MTAAPCNALIAHVIGKSNEVEIIPRGIALKAAARSAAYVCRATWPARGQAPHRRGAFAPLARP